MLRLRWKSRAIVGSRFTIVCFLPLPPTITDVSNQDVRNTHEVEDTLVQTEGWLFTKLLGGFSTEGALRQQITGWQQRYDEKQAGKDDPLFHRSKLVPFLPGYVPWITNA